MKKFLLILASVLIIGYLIYSVVYFNNSTQHQLCNKLEIVVKDSVHTQFVHPKDIEDLLKRKKIHPVGKPMSEVNTLAILDTILTNKLVKSARVYTAQNGVVVAAIYQREPVLRVISDTKGSFYIDNNRERMPVSSNFTVYVPIATGVIDEEYAKNELYDFAMFLNENPDWNAWIEQIVVKPNKDVDLIPRAGDFKIAFGKLDNYPQKFAKFALFIEKGLNVVGWNRYSEINLKYDNQVVCTKK